MNGGGTHQLVDELPFLAIRITNPYDCAAQSNKMVTLSA